jgi:integrase
MAVAALKRQRRAQAQDRLAAGSAWIDSGCVFTRPLGGALDPRNLSREYAEIAKAAGLPEGLHVLRHYLATVLIDGGASPREVADILGHSSVMVTLDLYSATIPESQRTAIERAAKRLGS